MLPPKRILIKDSELRLPHKRLNLCIGDNIKPKSLIKTLQEETIPKNNIFWIKIKGNSMSPIFTNGSMLEVSLCHLRELYIGDIVVFKGEEGFVCHRLFSKIRLNGNLFLKTKADTVYNFDPLIKSERVVGKVVSFKKGAFTVRVDNSAGRIIGLSFGCFFPLIAKPFLLFNGLKNRWFIK